VLEANSDSTASRRPPLIQLLIADSQLDLAAEATCAPSTAIHGGRSRHVRLTRPGRRFGGSAISSRAAAALADDSSVAA